MFQFQSRNLNRFLGCLARRHGPLWSPGDTRSEMQLGVRSSAELLGDNLPTARWAERSFDRCGVFLSTIQECAASAVVKVNFLRRHLNVHFVSFKSDSNGRVLPA